MRISDTDGILRIAGDFDRLLVEVLDPILRDRGLGREHWQALRLLAEGPKQMGQISSAIGRPGATATRVVDALVEKALVHRRSDPLDRRRVLVQLSGLGEQTLERIEGTFHDAATALASDGHDQHHHLFALLDQSVITPTAAD